MNLPFAVNEVSEIFLRISIRKTSMDELARNFFCLMLNERKNIFVLRQHKKGALRRMMISLNDEVLTSSFQCCHLNFFLVIVRPFPGLHLMDFFFRSFFFSFRFQSEQKLYLISMVVSKGASMILYPHLFHCKYKKYIYTSGT